MASGQLTFEDMIKNFGW